MQDFCKDVRGTLLKSAVMAPTAKQNAFIAEYLRNGQNGTKAALATYNTTDPRTAHAIASENLQKPTIRQTIDKALRRVKLRPEHAVKAVKDALSATKDIVTITEDGPVVTSTADHQTRL